ncbi:unnamed protein product [Cylindrotheca closterium]|uniref:Uncharacterized protein n=1 Tax=Cylindrotheca closterium TaxID=2856 RepID=A0AAD2JJP7_9STRA|nr:unnamed protein product [Cylindrotheca closterium]
MVDAAQCIPKAGGSGIASNVIDVNVFDWENVHQSHTGTPIIDGYVTLDVGNEGLTIFLQLSSPSKVRVSQMNEEVKKLDFAIGRHRKWEPERQWILLWITNREVDIDSTADERLLWVDKGSLTGHCPLIGNRGLVGW